MFHVWQPNTFLFFYLPCHSQCIGVVCDGFHSTDFFPLSWYSVTAPRVGRTDKLHSYVSGITWTFQLYHWHRYTLACVCVRFVCLRLFIYISVRTHTHNRRFQRKTNELFTRQTRGFFFFFKSIKNRWSQSFRFESEGRAANAIEFKLMGMNFVGPKTKTRSHPRAQAGRPSDRPFIHCTIIFLLSALSCCGFPLLCHRCCCCCCWNDDVDHRRRGP